MKALVVGCGSIGKRHIKNLIKLDNIQDIPVYTKHKDCLQDINDKGRIRLLKSLNDVEADFAIVANETYKHIDTALLLAKKGIHLFIEKPLSHNLDKVDVLREIAKKKKLKVFIGYNLRFLGAIEHIKEELRKGALGKLYFAKIEVGQYLPLWRPLRDYKDSYSASKKRGGGVVLDLSHEIDYMRYLFGEPFNWGLIKTKVSNLKIDSEDLFEGTYIYKNNFVCNVHLDYLQVPKKRDIKIVGSRGNLICDFIKQEITLKRNDSMGKIKNESLFDIDKSYIDELNSFIKAIEEDKEPEITLEDGIKALRLLKEKMYR